MNENIIYAFACERNRTTPTHEITSTMETFIQMYKERITHVQPITFLKEKHYLDACYGE
jgi:hypothetical protein